MSTSGKFIVVEGMEGCGKTTNMQFIQTYLATYQIPLVVTREPGGTPLAEEIRALLLANRDESVSEEAELLLMFAARAQHLAQKIKPALNNRQWVLCDRFTDATYAYQGGGRQLSQHTIATLETLVQKELRPDLIIILDVPIEKGLERAAQRGNLDRFEQEKKDFFERVRDVYLKRAKEHPNCYKIVDASLAIEEVQKNIQQILTQFMQSIL